jgi:hypothetical protein
MYKILQKYLVFKGLVWSDFDGPQLQPVADYGKTKKLDRTAKSHIF